MAAKDVKRIINILAYSGIARPTAKLGQALGPLGLNMAQICKEFNEMTQKIRPDVPMKATLSAFFDKTYRLEIRGPPLTWMIKRAAGALKGSPSPYFEPAGMISIYSVYDIANLKKTLDPAFKNISLQSICSQILGTCKSMGIHVVEDREKPGYMQIPVRKIGQK